MCCSAGDCTRTFYVDCVRNFTCFKDIPITGCFILTRRYSPLCGLTSCGGLRPRLFLALQPPPKKYFMLFLLILGKFWCSVVTSGTFISNLSNFEKEKKHTKIQKSVLKTN